MSGKSISFVFLYCMLWAVTTTAQVDIDKPINLSGGVGERAITNLELPVNGTDAVNKDYVDNAVSAGGGGFVHYVGELFGGGIVYYVYRDTNGDERGLIVSLDDISTGRSWSASTGQTVQAPGARSYWDGLTNSNAIMAQNANSAAADCRNYNAGGFTDWYLPAIDQLEALYDNITLYTINRALSISGGSQLRKYADYWASTEFWNTDGETDTNYAWFLRVQTMTPMFTSKSNTDGRVRAVRSF